MSEFNINKSTPDFSMIESVDMSFVFVFQEVRNDYLLLDAVPDATEVMWTFRHSIHNTSSKI